MVTELMEGVLTQWRTVYTQMTSAQCMATGRASGVLTLTAIILSQISKWTQAVFLISPFLAVDLLILAGFFLWQLWKRYYRDVNATVFKCLRFSVTALGKVKDECLIPESHDALIGSPEVVMRRQRNRKLVRIAVMFLMIQNCLAATNQLAWLHSLLAYHLGADVIRFLWRQFRLPTPGAGNHGNDDGNHSNRAAYIKTAVTTVCVCVVVIHQVVTAGCVYVCITAVYYILAHRLLETSLSYALQYSQCDVFEGLEQYYIQGTYVFLDILLSLVFMFWSLLKQKQLLMLAALYTNVYIGGREAVASVVNKAVLEWTTLAHFQRASREELQVLDDVCAICLCSMKTARKTPCQHFFHGHCLRKCLKEKASCPICAQIFVLG